MSGAVVRVNEVVIFHAAPRSASEWWAHYLIGSDPGRFSVVKATIGGQVVDVSFEEPEHARRFIDRATEVGCPPKAVTLLRRPGAAS